MNDDLRERFGTLTSADVATLDRAAQESGVSVMQLMEIAGWQVARCAWRMLGDAPGAVLVVAGRGNNGGDGLVAARHLSTWGCAVRAFVLSEPERLSELAAAHVASARNDGVDVTLSEDAGKLAPELRASPLVIDGLLGTGLSAEPREPQASAIRALNDAGLRILSIDVPSGLDATSGNVPSACVSATATCTLTAMKAGLWTEGARGVVGDITVADIGMPRAAWERCGLRQPTEIRGGGLASLPTITR